MNTTRIPHAQSTPLPELVEFLAPFRVHFMRSEGRQSLERNLTGLLTEHPNKTCDTIVGGRPNRLVGARAGVTTAWLGGLPS